MPTLYVTEPRSTVRLSGKSLLVTAEVDPDGKAGPEPARRQTLLEAESHRLELIALFGRVHITSDAVRFCLKSGISVGWFAWNGNFLGRIVPEQARSADLRLLQYGAAMDQKTRFTRARALVTSKLANALEVLKDIQRNESGNQVLEQSIEDLKRFGMKANSCDSTETLLGLEGSGARGYFKALAVAFKGDIPFEGRESRPPPDPANALLSFGYVLLGNLVGGLLEARGMDPALGFFHEVRPGRASLALDLLEELRHPVVDRFVLRACNLRILRREMFEPDTGNPGGVRLTREGLKVFFREWEKHFLRPLRDQEDEGKTAVIPLIRRQVDRLAADLRGGAPYRPFAYGG